MTSPGGAMMSPTVCVVWTRLTLTVSTSALCLHRLMTLARYTPPASQGHRAERSVCRRRCHMALSCPWRWCLSVEHALSYWNDGLLRTRHRPCRQRHVTESHRTRLQHTTTRRVTLTRVTWQQHDVNVQHTTVIRGFIFTAHLGLLVLRHCDKYTK